MGEVRVDKWLWAVRIFKTRSLATDACKKGRVSIGGVTVKPSRTLQRGDIVSVRKPPVEYSFRVVELLASRVGAKRVPEFMENVTPAAQYELLELQRISGFSIGPRVSDVLRRRTAATWISSPRTCLRISTSSTGMRTGISYPYRRLNDKRITDNEN